MHPRTVVLASVLALSAHASPTTAVDALLEADRAAAIAAERTGLVAAVSTMLAPDATMPVPGRGFAEGREAIIAELRRDTLNVTSKARWAPLRGGVSADGEHGFTFGYLDVLRADGSVVAGKYLAYWVKRPEGWRIAAYRRTRRPDGVVDTAALPPALPPALTARDTSAARLAQHRASVMQVERDFAAEAQRIGLRAAFLKYGSADAVNLGGAASAAFVLGNEAIAAAVSQGVPEGTSPVNWGPERALVASSGDLGITFGRIVPNAPAPDGRAAPGIPFFTIWRRANAQAPWRYVAE